MQQRVRISNLKFSEPTPFKSQTGRTYSRRVLDLESLIDEFKYINALSTDGKHYLLIGTESGLVYVFSLTRNMLEGCFRSSEWINGLQLTSNTIFIVGIDRVIKCYDLYSRKQIFELPQITEDSAYSSKGIRLCDTSINNKVIANVGYGKFKIIDVIKMKVIYCFDIAKDTLNEVQHGNSRPTILNYIVIKKLFKVCYLLEEDDHIYFYNYKEHKLRKKLTLFEHEVNLSKGILLVNSLLLEQACCLFVILQFSTPKKLNPEETYLTSIIYVIEVIVDEGHQNIHLLFFEKLGMHSDYLEDIDFIISKSIAELPGDGDRPTKFHVVLGSSKGVSTTYLIDTNLETLLLFDKIVKSESTLVGLTKSTI